MSSEKKNKINIEVEKDGVVTKAVVIKPSKKEEASADLVYKQVYTKLFREGAILAEEVDAVARSRNLWTEADEKEVAAISEQIKADTKICQGKVKGTTKLQARDAAIRIRVARERLRYIRSRRSNLASMTCESQAGDAKFNHFIVVCTKTPEGKQYFKNVDDYLEKYNSDPVARKAFDAVMLLAYNADPDFEKSLPENIFLVKLGYARESDLHLIDKDGNPCDSQFRLVDEEDRLIDKDGNLVDEEGNKIETEVVEIVPDMFDDEQV